MVCFDWYSYGWKSSFKDFKTKKTRPKYLDSIAEEARAEENHSASLLDIARSFRLLSLGMNGWPDVILWDSENFKSAEFKKIILRLYDLDKVSNRLLVLVVDVSLTINISPCTQRNVLWNHPAVVVSDVDIITPCNTSMKVFDKYSDFLNLILTVLERSLPPWFCDWLTCKASHWFTDPLTFTPIVGDTLILLSQNDIFIMTRYIVVQISRRWSIFQDNLVQSVVKAFILHFLPLDLLGEHQAHK